MTGGALLPPNLRPNSRALRQPIVKGLENQPDVPDRRKLVMCPTSPVCRAWAGCDVAT